MKQSWHEYAGANDSCRGPRDVVAVRLHPSFADRQVANAAQALRASQVGSRQIRALFALPPRKQELSPSQSKDNSSEHNPSMAVSCRSENITAMAQG
jgi:hypothetical protein